MRIAFFAERFWPFIGGVEVNLADLVEPLRDRGNELLILTAKCGEELSSTEDYRGATVRRIEMAEPLIQRDFRGMSRVRGEIADVLTEFAPDVIHAMFTFGLTGIYLKGAIRASRPAPSVLTVPGLVPLRRGIREIFSALFDQVDAIVTPSQAIADALGSDFPAAGGRGIPILNGVTSPDSPPTDLLEENLLLCAGRLSSEKGYDLAIRALARLEPRLEARLRIAGRGPEEPALMRLAQEMGVADRVDFAGWVDPPAVWRVIDRASAVLVPSTALEGFGLVAAEASLRQRPVIAARTGGLPEVVADGLAGTLFEPGDVGALTHAIEAVLGDREGWASRGHAAAERARSLFGIGRQAEELEELYRSLVGQRQRGGEPAGERPRRARVSAKTAAGS